jgi:small GTP-binding protein
MTDRKRTYKIVVVGDAQSGKSSLLFRFVHRRFCIDNASTILAQFFSKTLPSGDRVNMWDTAGQERYRSLLPAYLKNIDLILYVYDITRKSSFQHLEEFWVDWSRDHATPGHKQEICAILVGNKLDLGVLSKSNVQSKRMVSTEEGISFAAKMGMPFFEVSVKDNDNIDAIWSAISNLLVTGTVEDLPKDNSVIRIGSEGLNSSLDLSNTPTTFGGRLSSCYGSSTCVLM